jgi:hypothetical protein
VKDANRRRSRLLILLAMAALLGAVFLLFRSVGLSPGAVAFSKSRQNLEAFEFVEVTALVSAQRPSKPFTDGFLRGTFRTAAGDKQWNIEGFCDSEDGSVYRIRFMPSAPGDYAYSVEYRQGWFKRDSSGTFHVRDGHRRGPVQIDPQNHWHFVWQGTGEHYFFNGTTAYWLMGWRDEQVIQSGIERLHQLKINRMRVTIAGRTNVYYGEPVMAGPSWTPLLRPWQDAKEVRYLRILGRIGQRLGLDGVFFDSLANLGFADDIYHPGFDYTRFQVSYWQKFERALLFARDRDIVFSLVLDMNVNDSGVHPAPGSADEQRFIKYAIARFGAFSNITWDLGDDLDRYRDDHWTHNTGIKIKQWDPYRHLATSHPAENVHQDRTSEWFDFTSFQEWSRQQHAFMLAERKEQERLGRIIPQTNEEYGYEDHYPLWVKGLGTDSADALRRAAWEIVMAGGYQTTGETARRGTNVLPDTGGGWMNGRGDDTMTMLQGYAHMVDFFTAFEWWKAEPHDEVVNNGNFCLAKPGEIYAVYLPRGGNVTVQMQPGQYVAEWWNCTTGEKTSLPLINVTKSSWSSPAAPGSSDWALLLQKK